MASHRNKIEANSSDQVSGRPNPLRDTTPANSTPISTGTKAAAAFGDPPRRYGILPVPSPPIPALHRPGFFRG
jgi:hypothetical protein